MTADDCGSDPAVAARLRALASESPIAPASRSALEERLLAARREAWNESSGRNRPDDRRLSEFRGRLSRTWT
jgi:hypothetical protein